MENISHRLSCVALGNYFDGAALMFCLENYSDLLTKEEKNCIHRYTLGSEFKTDHCLLQDIAIKLIGV